MKRILALVFSVVVIGVLWGCSRPHVTIGTFNKPSDIVKTNETVANKGDYKVIGKLPDSWEISLSGQNKGQIFKGGKPVGLIESIGYNGESTALPNHSSIMRTEDIDSGLGNGKLYILEQSTPAASQEHSNWIQIYSIIPMKEKNLAFGIWVNTDTITLDNDQTAMKNILKMLALDSRD